MTHPISDVHANPTQHRTVLLATDNKSSVLAEVVADKTNYFSYSAYGHQSAQQQQVATSLGFNGELCEARIGWYILGNGYRAYNPRLMRFHSPDNLSPFGKGELNGYTYCGGEPVMNKDATGHAFFLVFRTGLNNLMDTSNVFIRTVQAKRAAGQSIISTLISSLEEPLPNIMGAAGANGPLQLGAGNNPLTTQGWFHSRVGGVQSSTPDRGSNASLPGTSSNMWDRLAAKAQSTPVAQVKPNYGPSKQIAVVKPNQSTPTPPSTAGSSPPPVNPPVATVQPYRATNDASSNSTWSGESGPSDWSLSPSTSIRR